MKFEIPKGKLEPTKILENKMVEKTLKERLKEKSAAFAEQEETERRRIKMASIQKYLEAMKQQLDDMDEEEIEDCFYHPRTAFPRAAGPRQVERVHYNVGKGTKTLIYSDEFEETREYPGHGVLPISPPPIPPGVVRYDYNVSPPEMVYADGRRESILSNSKNNLPTEEEEPKITIGIPVKEDD